VPQNLVPFGAYTSVSQLDQLLKSAGCNPSNNPGCRGQVTTTQTIYQKMPVVSGMFSTLGQFRTQAGPAFQIPYGYVAQTIPLTPANSVQGAIQPGDDVDIIGSLTSLENTSGSNNYVPKQTQYVLNDVRVIGVNGPPPSPPTISATGKVSSSTSSSTTTSDAGAGGSLTVLVRYQQALILQHMKDFAGTWTMSVVLRSSKETDIPHFRTLPVFLNWFFNKQENHFDYKPPY
jgi:Flp pilus assembly protein CpaB